MGAGVPRFETVAVVVCDSVGCGGAPDAAEFGDVGSNTLGNVIEAQRPSLPNLARLGLDRIPGVPDLGGRSAAPDGAWGRMVQAAAGKDTMLGHWELMGVVVDRQLPLYPDGFPPALLDRFAAATGRGILGNEAASGTEIIQRLGEEHRRTGDLIVYTSGDSVFQVAAHEAVVPIEELYRVCEIAREQLRGEHAVGRVIARPFIGERAGNFRRTPRRYDLPLQPPAPTALDRLAAAGIGTFAVGKINDIFGGSGITEHAKTVDNHDGIQTTIAALRERRQPLIFTNLVDFDSAYGHRNDPAGYARALIELDGRLPDLVGALPPDGILILTADHGNDPTTPGTDHSRECVPLLVTGDGVTPCALGTRDTFADLAATILDNFEIASGSGRSFLALL